MEILGIADAVQAAHRTDDNHIPATAEQSTRSRKAQFLNLVVNRKVLLNIGIGSRKIGLRLIVIVVGYEIFHRILRKEGFELPVELGGQGLVVAENKCRSLQFLNHIGHSEGLAGACHSKQSDISDAGIKGLYELGYRLRLVSGRLISGVELKLQNFVCFLCATKIIKTGGNSDICPKSNFGPFLASLTVIEIVYVCILKLMPI